MNTLAIHGGSPVLQNKEGLFVWPRYNKADELDLIKQLHETVSIYNKSGVFEEFENCYAQYALCITIKLWYLRDFFNV